MATPSCSPSNSFSNCLDCYVRECDTTTQLIVTIALSSIALTVGILALIQVHGICHCPSVGSISTRAAYFLVAVGGTALLFSAAVIIALTKQIQKNKADAAALANNQNKENEKPAAS